ncbi:MAG: Rieske 2Fe-2S domain-containing protein [Angustibacter sp.]
MSPQSVAPRSLTPLWDLPVRWTRLDGVASTAKEVVNRVIGRGRVADVLHGRWLGHPAHPALAQVPVGAALGAATLDLVALATGDRALHRGARLLTAVATVSAAPTALAGWADFADLHPEQQRVGLVHAAGNIAALAAWSASLARRRPSWALAGTAVAGVAAGLGGHLSQRWAAGANHAEHVPHLAPEGWHRHGAVDELSDGRPHRVLIGEEPVVVVKTSDGLRALSATCAHLSAPLDEGEVESVRGAECIVCPWHGSAFALDGGQVVRGPATAPQPVVDLDVHDGLVFGQVRQPGE